jgi:hypothetical protein
MNLKKNLDNLTDILTCWRKRHEKGMVAVGFIRVISRKNGNFVVGISVSMVNGYTRG